MQLRAATPSMTPILRSLTRHPRLGPPRNRRLCLQQLLPLLLLPAAA